MSICQLSNAETNLIVMIGWDNPLQTYFVSVEASNENSQVENDVVLVAGWLDGDLSIDEAIKLIQPYARPFDESILREELKQDRINGGRNRVYTVPPPGKK